MNSQLVKIDLDRRSAHTPGLEEKINSANRQPDRAGHQRRRLQPQKDRQTKKKSQCRTDHIEEEIDLALRIAAKRKVLQRRRIHPMNASSAPKFRTSTAFSHCNVTVPM